jgi:hypothetical protein
MQRILLVIIFASLVAPSSSYLYAHHSFAAAYLEDKTAQVQGKLVQFTFRNPHSFLQIDSKDDAGKLVRWTVEWSGASQLGDQGITRDSLRPGDDLIITGNPGRNAEDHRLRIKSVQRTSDGLKWSGTVE